MIKVETSVYTQYENEWGETYHELEETYEDTFETLEQATDFADKKPYGWLGAYVEIYINDRFYSDYVLSEEEEEETEETNTKKIPQDWALMLAELHNKVMELQDTFDTIRNDLYARDYEDNEDIKKFLEGFDTDNLESEIEHICDKLDDLESETSELDCEYNDYE